MIWYIIAAIIVGFSAFNIYKALKNSAKGKCTGCSGCKEMDCQNRQVKNK